MKPYILGVLLIPCPALAAPGDTTPVSYSPTRSQRAKRALRNRPSARQLQDLTPPGGNDS
jgi:hypothetical protein